MLCVLFSHSRIGFLKNPDAKHTINFKQPYEKDIHWKLIHWPLCQFFCQYLITIDALHLCQNPLSYLFHTEFVLSYMHGCQLGSPYIIRCDGPDVTSVQGWGLNWLHNFGIHLSHLFPCHFITSHVDRQCPPLPHYPPLQRRGSAALFSHWITTDQQSISMKCNIRAPLYCTCFVAPLVHFPCFNSTYNSCSVIEGFTLPVHSKQMRLTLVLWSVNEVVILPLHCPYWNSTSICSYYTSKSCEDFLGIEGWKKYLHSIYTSIWCEQT